MWRVSNKQNQNQSHSISCKSNSQRKYSIGQDQGSSRIIINQGQADNTRMEYSNKKSININHIKVIEDESETRYNREQITKYPQDEDVKNIIAGDYNSMFMSGQNSARANQSSHFHSNQKSSQNFYPWGTNNKGTKVNQFYSKNSPNERRRSGMSSQNAGLFTSQKFFQNKFINNQMNKSHSISFMQGSLRNNNLSRNEEGNYYQNQISGMPRIEQTKSINDFLHRNYISLNIQQSMEQMDSITKETMKQQQQYNEEEQLQKLQENSKQIEQQNLKHEQGNFQKIQNKQYFIQIQKQLQTFQDQQNILKQKSINQDDQTHLRDNGCQFVPLEKSQGSQPFYFQSNQRNSTQQSEHSLQQKSQSNKEQALSQYSENNKSGTIQKITECSQLNSSNFKLSSQHKLGLNQNNFNKLQLNKEDQNNDMNLINSQQRQNIDEQQQNNTFYNSNKKSVDKNIFSLTGNSQVKNKLPYLDVLSLCNQDYIDILSSQRKSIYKEQIIENKQLKENQHNIKQNSIKQLDGLEGISIYSSKSQIKSQKLQTDSRFHTNSKLCQESQFHTDRKYKQQKCNLKLELNENLPPQIRLIEKQKNQQNQDTSQTNLNLKSRLNKEDAWKESPLFKLNKNYQQFTLKQLKGSLNNINFNPDGSPTQWRYYLQDSVKQSNNNQEKNHKNSKVQIQRKQNYESEGSNLDSSIQDEEYDQIYNFQQFEKEINENDNEQVQKIEKNKNQMNENTSFYKVLKKQSVDYLENNNISSYDIIDEQFDQIFQTHFIKNNAIRKVDMVYNIKHLAILKYKREKRLLEGSQDPNDLLDYIHKRNRIQILLHNVKKIKNLQKVAELIESKINLQNNRINNVVDQLLIKFDINQQK